MSTTATGSKKPTAKKVTAARKTNSTRKPATKVNPKQQGEIDEITKGAVKVATTVMRDIKYNYPDDINNPEKRKAWRQKTRAKLKSLEAAIAKAEGQKSIKAAHAALDKFKKEVLTA